MIIQEKLKDNLEKGEKDVSEGMGRVGGGGVKQGENQGKICTLEHIANAVMCASPSKPSSAMPGQGGFAEKEEAKI